MIRMYHYATVSKALDQLNEKGFTYDFNDSWYTVASVSYAKLSNKAQIDVVNQNTGTRLIHATTKVDIDPLITYLGVGYRF